MELTKRINDPNGMIKFVQVYIFENSLREPVIRYGNTKHKHIIEDLLNDFRIPMDYRLSFGEEIPREKAENVYELVGAGEVKKLEDGSFGHYGVSVDYEIGTNKKHLNQMKKFSHHKLVLMDYGGNGVID